MNNNNPQNILCNNRTKTPNIEELTEQVNLLARYLVNQQIAADLLVPTQIVSPISSLQNRALNSDFIVSATRNAIVFYTIELTTALTLSGTDSATVNLMVNSVSIGSIKSLLTLSLGLLSLGETITHQKLIMGFVPIGNVVNLTTGGTGTATIIQSMEVLI